MVVCPDCGEEVKDAKFCSNCGSRLPEADEVVSEEVEEKVEVPIEEETTEEPVEEVKEEVVEEVEAAEADVVEEAEVIEESVEQSDVEEEIVDEEVAEEEPASEESDDTIKVNVKKSKFCTNCGTEISPEAAFCPQCGYKFAQEEKPQTKFCPNCGKEIDINAEICPHCGVRVAYTKSSEEKNVLLSAILSFLFPGLGHLYLGLNTKGVSFIIAYIVSWALMFLLIGFVLAPIVWIWALIDSIKATEAINRGEFVEDKLF